MGTEDVMLDFTEEGIDHRIPAEAVGARLHLSRPSQHRLRLRQSTESGQGRADAGQTQAGLAPKKDRPAGPARSHSSVASVLHPVGERAVDHQGDARVVPVPHAEDCGQRRASRAMREMRDCSLRRRLS